MNAKQVLQQLVETDSMDERMNIVEENMSLFEESGEGVDATEIQTALDTATSELETSLTTIEELKTKYRERFFNGSNEDEDMNNKKDEPEEKPKDKTLTDLGY